MKLFDEEIAVNRRGSSADKKTDIAVKLADARSLCVRSIFWRQNFLHFESEITLVFSTYRANIGFMSRNRPPSQRQLKAGELIRRALAEILAKENIRDPDLQGVSVTISEVRASPDLKHAIVYAAPLGGGDSEKIIKALQRCGSFLRGRLGKEMEMKSTPRLKFVADTSYDTAEDMQRLLSNPKVAQDLQKD
jgi:ribosome-binding factor A